MSKKKKIILIIISLLVILILGAMLVYGIIENSKKPDISIQNPHYMSNENEDNTNKESKTKQKTITYEALENIPEEYTVDEAAKDGCVVMTNLNTIYNKEKLESFVINTSKEAENKINNNIRIVYYTDEGDAIITDVEYKKETGNYILTKDFTRDRFSAQEDRKITVNEDIPDTVYTSMLSEGDDATTFYLARYIDQGDYKDIQICAYSKECVVKEVEPSFYAKVVESERTYIIVEPFEGEQIRNSADRISISLGEDNDAIYTVGTNVKITYTGTILETYPAQIDVTKIELKSADSFDIIFEQYTSQDDKQKIEKIVDKNEQKGYYYNIYTYGGEAKITIDGKVMTLKEALNNGNITSDEILKKANQDLENASIRGDYYLDGGSAIYRYPTYTILKYSTLNGNRDMYIGSIGMDINVKDLKNDI